MSNTADQVTPEGRMSFPTLFEPRAMQGGDPKYSVTLLIPKDGRGVDKWIGQLRAAVQNKIEEKWPNADKRPAKFKSGIKDGDTCEFDTGANAGKLKKDVYPEMAGCWVIQASSKSKPKVINKAGQAVGDAAEAYAGRWAMVSFNLFAYDNVNVGVGCGLQNVLLCKDDDKFGSSSKAEDDFSAFINASQAASDGVQTSNADDMFA